MYNKDTYRFINFLRDNMRKPWFTLLMTICLMFLFLFLISMIGVLLAIPIFHLSYSDLSGLLNNRLRNAPAGVLKYFQIIQSVGLFVVPGILVYWILLPKDLKIIHKNSRTWIFLFLMVIFTLIVMSPFLSMLIDWNSQMHFPMFMKGCEDKMRQLENEADSLTQVLLNGHKFSDYVINMLMIAVIPAIGEELIFRGVLQQALINWIRKPFISITLAAAIFSAVHLQFYGFVPRMVLGMLFGYFFFRTGTIWIAIFAHFLNNGFAVTIDFISETHPGWLPGIFVKNYHTSLWEIVASLFVTVLFLIVFYRLTDKKKPVRPLRSDR